jgi:hypothetical protein
VPKVYVVRCEKLRIGNRAPLGKMAQALDVPMYVLFYDGEKPPKAIIRTTGVAAGWGSSGRDAKALHGIRRLMSRADEAT